MAIHKFTLIILTNTKNVDLYFLSGANILNYLFLTNFAILGKYNLKNLSLSRNLHKYRRERKLSLLNMHYTKM